MQKKMLCIVSAMNAGGAETFLMKIYRTLDRSMYQMDFAVNVCAKGIYDDEIKKLGGVVHHFPAKSISLLKYCSGLYNIIRRNHYTHVLRVTSNGMGFLDLAIAKKAGAKVCIARSSNSSDGGSFFSKCAHFLGKLFFIHFVDIMVAPSKVAAEYTFGKKNVLSRRVILLPNGLDLNLFKFDVAGRSNVRKELDVDDETFLFGHIGRFSKQKNHLFLLKVFSEIHKRNEKTKLVLVGSGELESVLKKEVSRLKISDYVIFTGIRMDVPQVLSAFDSLLFPSLYEGMPNVVIEAQACGLPCYVSDCVTKDAKISDNVFFLSIDSVAEWIDPLLQRVHMDKKLNRNQKIPLEYNIEHSKKKFENFFL